MSLELIIMQLLIYFFIGVVMGIIDTWNKKVMFWIFVFTLLSSIISFFMNPIQTAEQTITWMFIPNVIMVVLGMKMGRIIYEQVN